MRVASVSEDKTLTLHGLDGAERARLDISELQGRPRDMWACALRAAGTGRAGGCDGGGGGGTGVADVLAALDGEGDALVVASSLGRMVALSCRAMEEGHALDECSLVTLQAKAEPRVTCVVAWSGGSNVASAQMPAPATGVAAAPKTGDKKRPNCDGDSDGGKQVAKKIKAAPAAKPSVVVKGSDGKKKEQKKDGDGGITEQKKGKGKGKGKR